MRLTLILLLLLPLSSLTLAAPSCQPVAKAEALLPSVSACKVGPFAWGVFKPLLLSCRRLPAVLKDIREKGLQCVRTQFTNPARNKCYDQNVTPLQKERVKLQDACLAIGWGYQGQVGRLTGAGCESYEKYVISKMEAAKAKGC